MSVQVDAETLRQIPIFAECQILHLQLLAFASERQKFSAGEMILTQGKDSSSAYLVLKGRVKLTRTLGEEIENLATAEPGTFLGEVAMIGKTPCSISAQAIDSVSTARIDHGLFLRVVNEYPEFGRAVYAALARNLQHSLQDFATVRTQFVKARSFLDL